MIVVVAMAVAAATVPLAGGTFLALDRLRLRWAAVLLCALGIQIVIISVIPDKLPGVHAPAHLLSYVMAGAFFVANRRVPGLWLVALGGGLNFLAIAANGGVMPAVAHATAPGAAPGEFINSVPMEAARLAFLGDVFALPETWPLSNVFSVGDVVIVAGAAIVLHTACGSRLARRGRPPLHRATGTAASTAASTSTLACGPRGQKQPTGEPGLGRSCHGGS